MILIFPWNYKVKKTDKALDDNPQLITEYYDTEYEQAL